MPPRSQKSREYGTSGNLDVNGYVGDDYLTELDGHDGRATFDRMRRSDPIIALTLDVLSLPLRKATYRIEPASDDPVDVDIAAFIQSQLIDGYSKDGLTWDDVLKHALLMLPFGFSILEILWAFRDGLWTLDGLAPRLPQSIVRWQFGGERGRHLIGPIQQDSQGNETTLPVEKLLIFTRDREGDNYEGISILRRIYKPWFIKENAEKVNAIGIDRFGAGVPVMHVPARVKEGTPEWTQTTQLLEDFAVNEVGYVVEPEGYQFRIEGATSSNSGAGISPLPTIKHYDESIAKSMLQMFINLGTSQSGSRSLGSDFIRFFQQAEQAHADYLCAVFNRSLLPQWTAYNWQGRTPPKLVVSRIEELALDALAKLASAGLITYDEGVENAIRREQHLPEVGEEQTPAVPEQPEETADPDDDYVETEIAGRVTAEAAAELEKIQASQALYITDALLAGKSIPQIAIPHKKQIFDALRRPKSELTDDLLAMITEEMGTNVKLIACRAFNLLRRQRLSGEKLKKALYKAVQAVNYDALAMEAADFVTRSFPVMETTGADPEWEALDKPLRPIMKEGKKALSGFFDDVEDKMRDILGDF